MYSYGYVHVYIGIVILNADRGSQYLFTTIFFLCKEYKKYVFVLSSRHAMERVRTPDDFVSTSAQRRLDLFQAQ